MSSPIRFTYDASADAVAIQFGPAPKGVRPLTRSLSPQIRADFHGETLLAFEILDASTVLPAAALETMRAPVELLTLQEASRESKREPRTLRSAIAAGRIVGAVKRGRDWIVPKHALWNYLESLAPAGRPTNNKRAPLRKRRAQPSDA